MTPGDREARGAPASRRKPREREDPGVMGATWWVYMIECRGGKIYTGISKDPDARYRRHRSGTGAAFTRMNPPVSLLGKRPCGTRSDALRAEWALRRLARREKRTWAKEQADRPSSCLPGESGKTENQKGSGTPGGRSIGGEKAP